MKKRTSSEVQKDEERSYLRALLSHLQINLERSQISDSERPDFVCSWNGELLGVEMTEFHKSPGGNPDAYQVQASLKEHVVHRAQQGYFESGRPCVNVAVTFHSLYPLTKKQVPTVTDTLVELIAESAKPIGSGAATVTVPWNKCPAQISNIRISAMPPGQTNGVWYPDAGGVVTEVTSVEIGATVAKKAPMEIEARKRCDTLWLVIVNHDMGKSVPVQIADEARTAEYRCHFDRLYWLTLSSKSAIGLRCRVPDS